MIPRTQRMKLEEELAKILGGSFEGVAEEVIDLFAAEPSLTSLTAEFWAKVHDILITELVPHLTKTRMTVLEEEAKRYDIEVDLGAANSRASAWAESYSFELVKDLEKTSMELLQEKVAGFFEAPQSVGSLADSIRDVFGPSRSAAIAVTETTRAASEGEQAFAAEMAKLGFKTTTVVRTMHDDIVDDCEICPPKDGKDTEEVGHPPFHVRCRCGESTVILGPDGEELTPAEALEE